MNNIYTIFACLAKMKTSNNNEKIFISGMSGKGSNCNNLQEFKDHLYNKDDMVTINTSRFPRRPLVPERFGTIPEILQFDHSFFNVPQKEVDYMDPANRMMFEIAFEALLDAGINPFELRNTLTGFYLAATFVESEISFFGEIPKETFPLQGCYRSFSNQRFAHFLGLDGPNFLSDTACGSSLYCIDKATQDFNSGRIDCAIIFVYNLILTSYISEQFARLGVLSIEGICRTFDESANGYVRADGIYCLILQKGKYAKRQYAEIVHCETNCDGFKETGLSYPSTEAQQSLLNHFYRKARVDVNKIGYFEAHGTGTRAGDTEEMETIDKAICKLRDEPLFVGSLKSKMGHCETSSGLASLIKLCMILQTNLIPPNLYYNKPHVDMHGIMSGKIKVVTEVTPLPQDKPYVALNNFGFGGANGHGLLKKIPETKSANLIKRKMLLCISGRTFEAIEAILSDTKSRSIDVDFIHLLNSSFNNYIPGHLYRAYAVFNADKIEMENICRHVDFVKPLRCFFGDNMIGSNELMEEMKQFEYFTKYLEQFTRILNGKIMNEKLKTLMVQIGFVQLLNILYVKVNEYFGCGIGRVTCDFANGLINLEEAILRVENIEQQAKSDLEQGINKKEINMLVVGSQNKYEHNQRISLGNVIKTNALLECIGKLYLLGYNTNLSSLYQVKWPVKANTPMINHLIKWKHEKSWAMLLRKTIEKDIVNTSIALNSIEWQHIEGHNIDGRVLFPASGYIYLVWKVLSPQTNRPIRLENVEFMRACTIPKNGSTEISLQICQKTGNFEFTDAGSVVVTGRIKHEDNFNMEWLDLATIPQAKSEDIMYTKDIYKELRLRGYCYQNDFKQLQTCDVTATIGSIKWDNWITFIDNMFQMKELQRDSRILQLPTKLKCVLINPIKQWDLILKHSLTKTTKECVFPVYNYKDQNIIRSGFVEIRGYEGTTISKRKNPKPLLESHVFIPFKANLDIQIAIRVMIQIATENSSTTKAKIVEILPDVAIKPSLMEHIEQAINDTPMIPLEYAIINLTQVEQLSKADNFIIIAHNLSTNVALPARLKHNLKSNGFLISRERKESFNSSVEGFLTLCEYSCDNEKLILLRASQETKRKVGINISSNGFDWLEPLKKARKNEEYVVMYSEKQINGLMGMTKCIIRESSNENIQCVCINDSTAPVFDINSNFYNKQLSKNLCFNVYKNGVWGSYRHLLLDESLNCKPMHSYVNNMIKGDISSLSWLEGPLNITDNFKNIKQDEVDVHVYAATINLKDVLIATGKVNLDLITNDRMKLDSLLGCEFAGKIKDGGRVMGLWNSKTLANYIRVTRNCLWKIPDDWTMHEASTVPYAYTTLIYGLLIRANLRRGESILIHNATLDIGLSAINIALHYSCNIFLTVDSVEKREYIMRCYPSINPKQVGESTISFYELVLKQTNGKGVDVILNSLSEEKVEVCLQCLRDEGRFIELGKYDSNHSSLLNVALLSKNAEYHGIHLDKITLNSSTSKHISDYFIKGIKEGYVRPLPYSEFQADDIISAFKHGIDSNHIGKVIINIRAETGNEQATTFNKIPAIHKAYFSGTGCYIILGGLGGFGLEFTDWLIVRGARKVLIASRKGITSGYQQLRKTLWESYGCQVQIFIRDATTKSGCKELLQEAQTLGDVLGIFNIAAVLKDALLENQTEAFFLKTLKPKYQMTLNLDELTRSLTPHLEYFIIFSSASCGRGNSGQCNYGYANSLIERLCEKRHAEALPGKAIQWSVIGDVGMLADNEDRKTEVVIGGMLQQKIASCLEVLDIFMFTSDPIVSSMVVFEKTSQKNDNDLLSVVLGLMQIENVKTVSPSSTFSELGMDSMMAVEIKQTLEQKFNLFLPNQELRSMNISRLMELTNVSKK